MPASRIVTYRATELLCARDNGLDLINQSEVEGADDFTENHMDMLVPVVTLEESRFAFIKSKNVYTWTNKIESPLAVFENDKQKF